MGTGENNEGQVNIPIVSEPSFLELTSQLLQLCTNDTLFCTGCKSNLLFILANQNSVYSQKVLKIEGLRGITT